MTETCRTCGVPLAIGEYRYCARCWTAYWNRMLEGVTLDVAAPDEQARRDEFAAGIEEDLTGAGLRLWHMMHLQDFGRAGFADPYLAHGTCSLSPGSGYRR